ncbi:MAG: biotin--[acetyl-CoA-carboxylase] ligase [SAR202 cluster bacterium]|nr:biotin--[acetyl-CoA-carboxylase] ligase [SAR202 cluster bacterium]
MSSTMDLAWEMARDDAPDGTVIIADEQSAGRGRYERSWISAGAEDILCSIVLKPRLSLVPELLMLAALGCVDVAENYGLTTGIKWPNDVQINGRKLAGVIAESITGLGSPDDTDDSSVCISGSESTGVIAVIGIGLNVNLNPMDHTEISGGSTSLRVELHRTVDRAEVFGILIDSIDRHYSYLLSGGTVLPAWRERLTTLGREVTVVHGSPGCSAVLNGLAVDVDSAGRLIVRDPNHRDWPVSSGEVTIREIK